MTIKRKTKGKPDEIDIEVGRRLRNRRAILGMSQEKLGELIGLTFQQVQKYEKGTNRVAAGRLYRFSKILDVPVNYFFDDIEDLMAEDERKHITTKMSCNQIKALRLMPLNSDKTQKAVVAILEEGERCSQSH